MAHMSLQSFLNSAKQRLKSTSRSNLTFVLGNESADLDSLCSAIGYSYIRQLQQPNSTFIPLAGIPRDDFKLRLDCDYAFRYSVLPSVEPIEIPPNSSENLIHENLTYLDEIDFKSLDKAGFKLILTDHNKLANGLEFLGDTVDGVIDHHVDSGSYLTANPRIIKVVGSTCSLVAEKYKEYLSSNSDQFDPTLGKLLLSAILIDTGNLRTDQGRTTQTDVDAVEFLSTNVFGSTPNRETFQREYFERLSDAKSSVRHLSSRDLLRKDYKEWIISRKLLGMSSLNWFFRGDGGWLQRDGDWKVLFERFEEWRSERRIDLLVVMTSFDHKGVNGRGAEREWVFMFGDGVNVADRDVIVEELLKTPMNLEDIEVVTKPSGVYCFRQVGVEYTRKKLQPLIEEIMKRVF
ncbi:Exopolyphosphatase [Nowakowskiella sp. JEL0407]|nr:Exopolyphosphatase [Nowakowskiella sp. JEL0407]